MAYVASPSGWMETLGEEILDLENLKAPETHFIGMKKMPHFQYPKNANVATSVALAGLGFENKG